MDQKRALARLREITDGIDACESTRGRGWWETSTGATFGAGVLGDLEDLVRALTEGD